MNEEKIIRGIKKKNEASLKEFIKIYGPILKASIYKSLSLNQELRMEVLNDSLLAIWDNIDSFDPSRSSFKNWCAGIGKYKAIDALRKELRHKSINIDTLANVLESDEELNFDESDKILAMLDEDDREIFRKLFIEGYSYDDISNIYDISKDKLYNKISRKKKLLRKKIGGDYE
ncbi:sigma-70 family RNA polymerase sigma factor [Anaerococcus sp. AGMB00486]|uniref:Sigma-70 family RNA polymerase sigma factor n=2 Tax=Anaerococcus TaxID=165779 RepID=A0ABX2N9A0_9FIRM|nr:MULTISPECIES: sigma-70 family RNA polymerase sigma factor [Anaerococcus]MSS77558.1 sigma-70 family RNA polymerase sigma factor [Anaerococcus porci]NVF11230.1 sigma-70 family RNA polymerase sigma factor [Anaerococcus faecalis]